MSEEKKNNLSRRDALKVLGAAVGATLLANLPQKWSAPELVSGVLPAHAQTSCNGYAVFVEILEGDFTYSVVVGPDPDLVTGDGGPDSTLGWNCQPGCLVFYLDLFGELASTGRARITTMAGTFIEEYDGQNNIRDISVILETGAYASNPDEDPSQWICGQGEGQDIQSPAIRAERSSSWQ